MIPHDILTLYSAKMLEYGIAILFLLLFIPFWRFSQSSARALAAAPAAVPQKTKAESSWFPVPADRLFHRGHAWARQDADGLVTVGLDGFAARLVGPLASVALPQVGSKVGQGERGWRLVADDGKAIEMLAPVDGTIAAINTELTKDPDAPIADPYGKGWLFRVRPERLRANLTNLLTGQAARRWMDETVAELQARMSPGLGALAQDGGVPVSGMARVIDAADWHALAQTYLLTSDKEDGNA